MTPPFVCRNCRQPVTDRLLDLGDMPLANAYLARPDAPESVFPLRAVLCQACFLVQLDHQVAPERIFTDYAYFTSYSDSALAHARQFCALAIERFGLGRDSLVMEIASNDGYLLKNFVAAGIAVMGIEPAANVAAAALEAGVPTEICFFGQDSARRLAAGGQRADMLIANNVLAHTPDLAHFIAGFAACLKPDGVVSLEFPHLLRLIEQVQFDTIYHEHYSYLSLLTVEKALAAQGLRVFEVESLSTHGGSLRVFACLDGASHPIGAGRDRVRALEAAAGLDRLATYQAFGPRVDQCRRDFRNFIDGAKAEGKRVAAYGAAAKGNTFLNYCGITSADIGYVVDRSPHKQGRFLPGSHLPIDPPDRVATDRPDYLLILPWNLATEIAGQMAFIGDWGGRFVTAIPDIRVWS